MKKLYVLAWLMMLSIVAMAQTIIVVDKDGNRIPYDPSKITSIEFQTTPPGFIINKDGETINFTYDVTKSILGNPNHVFVDPEMVIVNGEGEDLAVQVKANVDFNVTTSASWVTLDTEAKDGMCYVKVVKNPSVDERTATVTLTSKDGTLACTLNVVQSGKEDSRYISTDWEKDKLESFDPETGVAVITFAEEVPIMGEYDIVMVPDEMGTLMIRIIEEVTSVAGKTATLKTTEGDMGNLFRNQELTFELGGDGSSSISQRAPGSKPVFRPEKVEILKNGKYVEVYNARANRAPSTQELTLDYEGSDIMLESWGNLTFKIQKAKLAMKFKGTLEFSFERQPWYKVWKGHTTKASVLLEGDSEGETVLDISCRTPNEMSGQPEPYSDDMMKLKTGVVQRRYTFNVEGVPVQVVLNGDVLCNHGYQCLGQGDVVGGHKYSKHFKYGLTCVDDNLDGEFIYEETPTFNLIYPEANIGNAEYKNSQCHGRAGVRPTFHINFYGQYCRTQIGSTEWTLVNPRSWLPYPDEAPDDIARHVRVDRWSNTLIHMYNIPGWLLDHSAGDNFPSDEVGKTQTLMYNPEDFTLETPERDLMQDDEQDIEVTVFHYDYTANEKLTSIGALVAFEIEGSASGDKKLLLKYTDENGKAKVTFKKGEPPVERVNIKLCKSAGDDNVAKFVEKKWTSKLLKYNIQCLNPSQEVEKGAEAVPVHFLLQKTEGNDLSAWAHKRVEFVATNGTVTPTINYTDENGLITAYFTPTNSAPEGEVLAIVTEEGNKKVWEGRATGKITIKGGGGGGGGGGGDVFDKAKKLDDNVYVVSDKDGNESTRGLLQDWSQWNRGKAGCDSQTRVIKISLEDGKTDPATGSVDTQGGGYFEIPIDHFGEPMQLLLDYLSNYGAIQGSFFTFKKPDEGYSSSNYLNLKFGCGDMHNLKSGTVQLQKKGSSANAPAKASRRALEEDYSGELELVFAFTFTNLIYDNETGQETEDAEYTVYGKAVVNEFSPKITYYKLEPESGFVGVGKSVAVNVKEYYDEDAVWNWDDVELVASYVNYANYETDEGYFSWDPATHSLTSLKSNNNESVYVRFRLKSNPELTSYFTIRTGDGWPYTAFTISPGEQTVEHGYTCQFNIESWEPADIAWNPYAIEIDPATNPGAYHKYFIYEPGFPRFRCSYAAEAGTYDVRMRLMSDHSVGFTMKITVTAEE